MSNKIQHVFLVTNGPSCELTTHNGSEDRTVASSDALRQQLMRFCQTNTRVAFWVMSGITCLDVPDVQGRLEVQPLLLKPIPMVVTIEKIFTEAQNPLGVGMLARVQEMKDYRSYLPSNRYNIPVIELGDQMYISYHLLQNTGGTCKLANDVSVQDCGLLVRSHNELQREAVTAEQPGQRGRSVYKVSGKVEGLTLEHKHDRNRRGITGPSDRGKIIDLF